MRPGSGRWGGGQSAWEPQPGGTRGSLPLQHCGLASSLTLNRDWEKQLHTLPPLGHLTPASQATPQPQLPFLPQRTGAAGALSESAVSSQPLPLGDFRWAVVLAAGPQEAALPWETDRQEADRWATRPGPYPSSGGEAGEAPGERRETAETVCARVCVHMGGCVFVCKYLCMQMCVRARVCFMYMCVQMQLRSSVQTCTSVHMQMPMCVTTCECACVSVLGRKGRRESRAERHPRESKHCPATLGKPRT